MKTIRHELKVVKNLESGLFEVHAEDGFVLNSFHCQLDAQAWADREAEKRIQNCGCAADAAKLAQAESSIQCPVCGFYCLGKGGVGCIDKPEAIHNRIKQDVKAMGIVTEMSL